MHQLHRETSCFLVNKTASHIMSPVAGGFNRKRLDGAETCSSPWQQRLMRNRSQLAAFPWEKLNQKATGHEHTVAGETRKFAYPAIDRRAHAT
jgi:hypothetical protein